MGRKPVIMELISNRSSRASTFKKRRASVIKKAEELSKLCGIDVCVLVSAGPDDPAPVVWPPQEQSSQIISHFQSQSEVVRSKKQSSGQVGKLQHQLQKIERETDNILKDMISDGSRIGDTASSDNAANLSALVERRLKEVEDRINFLKSAPVESQMPGVLQTIIDMEQDPVMGSIGADGTNLNLENLPLVLPSEEEMSGLLLDESKGSDWISNGVYSLEWDDVMNDWMIKFITAGDDVAPLPDLADFDVGCSAGTREAMQGAATGSFPAAGCTVEVGMSGFPTGSDWISSGEPIPEWDELMKDRILEPSTANGEPFTIDDLDLEIN